MIALALLLLLLSAGGADAARVKSPLLDKDGVQQGFVVVNLARGSVKGKATLAPLPATVDPGTETAFQATIYMAYLASSTDEAVEVPLGRIYPNAKSKIRLKAAFKGDLGALGLDRVLVVAFSKDGLSSFDVLTAALDSP
jgi:hypothetical protein